MASKRCPDGIVIRQAAISAGFSSVIGVDPAGGRGLAEQPAELVDRLGLGVVLGEVDLNELAQRGCLSEALFLAGALERAVECLLGGLFGREAAALHTF